MRPSRQRDVWYTKNRQSHGFVLSFVTNFELGTLSTYTSRSQNLPIFTKLPYFTYVQYCVTPI